jgi:GntR family transcriptional repressor for pyruvate dehydrogenase complex
MKIQPIQTKKIYQEIIGSFVGLICNDELKIGDKLPSERELCDRFQVSRPSVREALRVMQTVGFVSVRAGGGAYITEFNIEPFLTLFAPLLCKRPQFGLELMELRELVEVKSVELAAQNPSKDFLEDLEMVLLRMEASIKENINEIGVDADIKFHQRIIHSTNNFVLVKASEFINTLMEISIKDARALVLERAENSNQLLDEHKKIYDGIFNRSPDEAAEAMKKHLRLVRIVYEKYYSEMNVNN